MAKKFAFIDPNTCDNSPMCPAMRACPAKAIQREGKGMFGLGGKQTVDRAKCTGCGLCVRYCPHRAIELKDVNSAAN